VGIAFDAAMTIVRADARGKTGRALFGESSTRPRRNAWTIVETEQSGSEGFEALCMSTKRWGGPESCAAVFGDGVLLRGMWGLSVSYS